MPQKRHNIKADLSFQVSSLIKMKWAHQLRLILNLTKHLIQQWTILLLHLMNIMMSSLLLQSSTRSKVFLQIPTLQITHLAKLCKVLDRKPATKTDNPAPTKVNLVKRTKLYIKPNP